MSAERRAHWAQKLSESRSALFELLDSLSPEQWQTPVFTEGDTWTVGAVLGHLVENERGMSIHVHKIRNGEATIAEDFDLERWNAGVARRVREYRAARTEGQRGRRPRQNAGSDALP